VNLTFTASTLVASTAAVAASYLAGSIPFAYLVAYWKKGIDIRAVGSGNPGATNVGRELGFRYFVLVLVLDLLKGLLPTLGLPRLVNALTGSQPVDLPVLLALAAILGHTFSVFLRFRGGKGVATSLGAVLALDHLSCAVAFVVFLAFLAMTRYVSLSSLVGGAAFVVTHFLRASAPLSREQIAMSLFSISILALLIVRHRGNLARIWGGTERRVSFGRRRGDAGGPPAVSGRVILVLVAVLIVLSLAVIGGVCLYQHASEPIQATAGLWGLRETDRTTTGQQRIDRVAFLDHGSRLAATCPRYNRVLLYQVELHAKLNLLQEIELEGRPVALATVGNRFVVLVSPSNDQRHLEPGWWQSFDFDGHPLGGRSLVGFYPDDLAVTPDGKHILVVTSGRAEGDDKKPMPALQIFPADLGADISRPTGRVTFDARDDPVRIALSASGSLAAVLLTKTNETLAIDLQTPESPRVIGRTKPSAAEVPYVSHSGEGDWILMPVASQSEAIAIEPPPAGNVVRPHAEPGAHRDPEYLLCTRQRDSVLDVVQTSPLHSLGHLPLKGPLNLGRTRPSGLAYSPERGLVAVSTRTGTIHLIELYTRSESDGPPIRQVATKTPDDVRR
jgi:acyl-phosphate glycerol 3-phosphate acyltransferase